MKQNLVDSTYHPPVSMVMPANAQRFQESITRELDIIKDRVRDLIGGRHWGEEGRFKEAILKNVIKRFLPTNLSIGTGFIIDSENGDDVSRQLDIIIYDNTHPVLFSEGDFIITTKYNVKAIIEVKSRISTATLYDVVRQFDESVSMLMPFPQPRRFMASRSARAQQATLFLGVFGFEFEGRIDSLRIDDALRESRHFINHVCLGPNIFIRKWDREDASRLHPPIDAQNAFYNLYDINTIGFSYFISNLLDSISGGLRDRRWFSFPIEGTKEAHRLRTVVLPS